ncbi:MAG TPA: winged helix-turn-helix domain-containing protein [Pyrinomonadaceae bacterium]|jgi:DNA-binding winged helix-turn-helix (wHTH) protein/tetratricopeptide (TPR) repeat protein|nr:winged helix-turn-helix domain-containing protein [Pyrinomonadaceae bacterium]
MEEHTLYTFGPFTLDVLEKLLCKENRLIAIPGKAFDLLALLVGRGGRLVERKEIMERLWAEVAVGPGNLAQTIYLLRKALGDDPAAPRYIMTVPRNGLRFVAPVKRIPANAASPATPYSWTHRQSSRRADEVASPQSIAVLPFHSLDAEEEGSDRLLGLGMADALTMKLSGLGHIKVRPVRAVMKYLDSEEDAFASGRELGVDAVITGTIQKACERIRVSVSFQDVDTARMIWSGKFDNMFTDIFALQDTISEQIAASLTPLLNKGTPRQPLRRESTSAEAYQLYCMGVYHWGKRAFESLNKAIQYLQQAVTLDPQFAKAYAYLADSNLLIEFLGFVSGEKRKPYLSEAKKAAERAISLDDTLAEAYVTLAAVTIDLNADLEKAERLFQHALKADPNSALAQMRYGYFLRNTGRLRRAFTHMKLGLELDPTSPIYNAMLAELLFLERDFDQATKYITRSLELDPYGRLTQYILGSIHLACARYQEATEAFQRLFDTERSDRHALLHLGLAHAFVGRTRKALEILNKVETDMSKETLDEIFIEIIITLVKLCAALKQSERAFCWLNKVEPQMSIFAVCLHYDPLLDGLREDPRYQTLLRRHPLLCE